MLEKSKITKWNKSAGGIFFPEELDLIEKYTMELADKEKVQGILGIYEFPADDDGTPIREKGRCLVAGKNLIVNSGRGALASMHRATAASLAVVGTYDLGYLAVGSGSVGGAGHTPLPADTSLQTEDTDPVSGPVVSGVPRPTLQVSTPPPGPPFVTNLWTAQIGTTQLNGTAIDEAGLYCLDDTTLFSYRTFAAQTKAAGFVLEFRWSVLF